MKVRCWLMLGVSLLCYFMAARFQILLFLFLAGIIVIADKTSKQQVRKISFLIAILLLVMGFVVFKVNTSMPMLVGYSVFAFSGISFIIDQYKDKKKYGIVDTLVYLFFFPKMMAGPIVRASNFIPQLALKSKINNQALYKGFKLILFGCFLKLIVADNLLDTESGKVGINLFAQTLIWGIRFYIDFFSYSIIAVGLAFWCGIELPYNFDNPYSATSFRDFWKRWNITLTSWLRDYIYIPLGGNRQSKLRTLINIFLTFIVSGLWHGISIPFVLWGCFHAFLVCMEKLLGISYKNMAFPFKIIYRVLVIVITMFLWQLFRFRDSGDIYTYLERLQVSSVCEDWTIVSLLMAVASLIFIENKRIKTLIFDMGTSRTYVFCEVILLVLMLALLILCPNQYSFNFFYFNF